MIKEFLVLPAYIAGITGVAAAAQLLQPQIGLPIAAMLSIAMLTYWSLTHRATEADITIHVILWGLAFGVACALANTVFASIPGPMVSVEPHISWWQLAFVVTQQVCYFGIHAFPSKN